MLVLTRKLGENIRIGDSVKITVLEVRSGQVKLGIEAPPEIKVHREEIYARIQEENRRAQRRKAQTPTGTGAAVEGEGNEPTGPFPVVPGASPVCADFSGVARLLSSVEWSGRASNEHGRPRSAGRCPPRRSRRP